jgi:hypothetical protein
MSWRLLAEKARTALYRAAVSLPNLVSLRLARATEPRLTAVERLAFGKMWRVSALAGGDRCRKDLIA